MALAGLDTWILHAVDTTPLTSTQRQAALEALSIRYDEPLPALHPLPDFTRRWGYDHVDGPHSGWPYRDDAWTQATASGSWVAGMLRLVSGWKSGKCSRPPWSYISLDTYSIGIAHFWAATAPRLLARIATEAPLISAYAWGAEAAWSMREREWLPSIARPRRRSEGQRTMGHDSRLDGLAAGWQVAARHPAVVEIQCDHWLRGYVGSALATCQDLGWSRDLDGGQGGLILAAVTRLHNSGAALRRIRRGMSETKSSDPVEILRATYYLPRDRGGYGKPYRWKKLTQWQEFTGSAPSREDLVAPREIRAAYPVDDYPEWVQHE